MAAAKKHALATACGSAGSVVDSVKHSTSASKSVPSMTRKMMPAVLKPVQVIAANGPTIVSFTIV